jgi:hypothetical protein
MTWGIPTDIFLQIHIIISLVGILSGFLVLYGLLTGRPLDRAVSCHNRADERHGIRVTPHSASIRLARLALSRSSCWP